ncbi:unnamed protein product [Eretmochelys imbricata]
MEPETRALLEAWRGRLGRELDAAIGFWARHSHDPEHGGFFSCLGRDGAVYDDVKYVWLQGRQVWVYARLYRTVPRFRRPDLLEAARAGEPRRGGEEGGRAAGRGGAGTFAPPLG